MYPKKDNPQWDETTGRPKQQNAIVRHEPSAPTQLRARTVADLEQLGRMCAASGFFQDSRQAAQACVKIAAGNELGLGPVQSMTSINVIKGRVTMSAQLMAALLARAGYKIKTKRLDNEACVLHVFSPSGEDLGESSFTLKDAQQAGLRGDNWTKYPRNMLRARAISNAARWFAPEVLIGVYLESELAEVAETATAIPERKPLAKQLTPEVVADDGAHPGDRWKQANRRLRAVARDLGVSNDEVKACIIKHWEVDSSKKMTALELESLADDIEMLNLSGPEHQGDLDVVVYCQEMIAKHGDKVFEDARERAENAKQTIMIERAIAASAAP